MKLRFTWPVFVAAILLAVSAPAAKATPTPDDGKPHKFALHDSQFFIDDQPMRIVAGEIHPGRIQPEFWDDRIKKAKAMGINTISIYLFWNQIEPTEGNFSFTGISDIHRFVKLCQGNGMWVIVRAGPYICGEWEFGGFPAWFLKHPELKPRTNEPTYMNYCKQYIDKLHDQLGDLQVTHGGPIIMVQIENELHRIDDYLKGLQDDCIASGFDCQLMTCDPSGQPWTTIQGLPNVLRGYNGFPGNFDMRYQQASAVAKPMGYPIYSPEVYTGWFALWGQWRGAKSAKVSIQTQLSNTQTLIDHKDVSWCFYLFNGGTNFGYMAGPNSGRAVQTSYDYDSPVDELGRVTPKYKALRDLLIKGLNINPPPIPADPAVIEIPAFSMNQDAPLLSRLPDAVSTDSVEPMEMLGQNYGFIDYRKTFPGGLKGKLELGIPRDYASVMIDGKVVGEAFSALLGRGSSYSVDVNQDGPCTLDILVHNLGRNSLPVDMVGSKKGLSANPKLDGTALTGWQIYSLPLDDPSSLPAAKDAAAGAAPTGPTFYTGTFNLRSLGETYLDMTKWHFGVVWVNGHNLGRYWDVGATQAIYLPSSWQKVGANQITVLELGKPPETAQIQGVANMIETPSTPIGPLWVAAPAPVGRGN
jgi:beta-galactosidase